MAVLVGASFSHKGFETAGEVADMSRMQIRLSHLMWFMAGIALLTSCGCQTLSSRHQQEAFLPPAPGTPKELCKVILPQYTIEPPDVLRIEAVRAVPKPPYSLRTGDLLAVQIEGISKQLRPGDVLTINATGTLADAPINNVYPIGPDGQVNLGQAYGSVKLADMTLEEAPKAIQSHLSKILVKPEVTVTLAQSATPPSSGTVPVQMGGTINLGLPFGTVGVGGMTIDEAQKVIADRVARYLGEARVLVTLAEPAGKQLIAGEHLVNPDGTVNLGTYGSVTVVGLTVDEAKAAIEHQLAHFLEAPEVSVSVTGYNSKVYYVVMQGAGLGDRVFRFPVTGNETVLDAISQLNGLTEVSSKRIWIARPTPDTCECQVLPVDWDAISAQAAVGTNYQLLPGDRLFVAEDNMVAFDTALAKIMAPWERVMGFSLLGVGTVTRFSGPVLRGGGNRQSTF